MNGAFVERSIQCVALLGEADATATRQLLAKLPSDSHDELLELMQDARTQGTRQRLGITRNDRPLLVVDILPVRLTRADETPVLVVLYDSSEFETGSNRPKQLLRRNEAILRSSMDGFFVVNEDFRFLEVNEAFCRMTGFGADELLLMRITDLEVDEAESGGVPSHKRTGLHRFPTAHRAKDGRVVHLEISINVLYDNGHKILVGFARDVTDRLRAERELARLTRQQQLILDAAAEGIAGLDPEGRVTFINPAGAQILGMRGRELIGRHVREALFGIRNGDGAETVALLQPITTVLRDGGRALGLAARFARVDGTSFPVEYSLNTTAAGRESGGVSAVLVFKDISERLAAEEAHRALERQVQQAQRVESLALLAGGIAHDLNNMLQAVRGNIALALDQLPADAPARARLTIGSDTCDRATQLIRQVLASSGQVKHDPAPLSLNELIEETKREIGAALPPRIELELRPQRPLPLVFADRGQVAGVLWNLVTNAAEACGDGQGRITVATQVIALDAAGIGGDYAGQPLTVGTYVAVEVADTGCGMSDETLEHIFEPFFSHKGAGRGLGLAAMRGIVRVHQGGVRVESEVGRGSRFTLVFPALKNTAPQAKAAGSAVSLPSDATVLVVDDDEQVRDVIQAILSSRGMRVIQAESGTRGVELFRRHADDIDVVLLDLTMPDKRGEDVFREILRIRPSAKVVIASGYSERGTAARFGDPQPAAFVDKPFTTDKLLERIGGVLAE